MGSVGLILLVGAVVLLGTGYTTIMVVGSAMEPTYSVGERVILERIDADEVRRGDVVLHQMPDRYKGGAVLRRVIGVGGDRVAQQVAAPVTVNGKPLAEPYVKNGDPSGMAPRYDVVVPPGRLFLLGDYRANSNDSRYFLSEQSGTVAAGTVQARALHDRTGLLGLALAALLGVLLTVTALVLSSAARAARRRSWPAPVVPASA
ncbi:signal peptidase I [Streptomyces inhibens]|uniref:signal peptidase I n=1 Tax=Streptomyces inhibens TaxID=2293571 RepID=UPI0037B2FDEA